MSTFPHQFYGDPFDDSAYGKYMWIVDGAGGPNKNGSLYRLNIDTGQRTEFTSPLFNDPQSVFANGPFVWIINVLQPKQAYSLLRLTIATGAVTRIDNDAVSFPVAVTSRGATVWYINAFAEYQVVRLTTTTGESKTYGVRTAGESVITSDHRDVWVGGSELLRISLSTDRLSVVDPEQFTDVRHLASDGTHLWAIQDSRYLLELDIASGRVTRYENPLFAYAEGLASDGHYVWIPEFHDKTVIELDVATGQFSQIRSGLFSGPMGYSAPYSVASDGSRAWVTVVCNAPDDSTAGDCSQVVQVVP